MLIRTGGYHTYAKLKVANGDEYFKEPIWPYVKKLDGYHQKLNKSGKMNGSISAKKPYVNLTVYKPTMDKKGRLDRVKTYFHIIVARARSLLQKNVRCKIILCRYRKKRMLVLSRE